MLFQQFKSLIKRTFSKNPLTAVQRNLNLLKLQDTSYGIHVTEANIELQTECTEICFE